MALRSYWRVILAIAGVITVTLVAFLLWNRPSSAARTFRRIYELGGRGYVKTDVPGRDGGLVIDNVYQCDWNDDEYVNHLVFENSQICDCDLDVLSRHCDLYDLTLDSPSLTIAAFDRLARFKGLARLKVKGKQVDDDWVARIADLFPALKDLDVSGTSVADRGLLALEPLDKLVRLNATDTRVTLDGSSELDRMIPGLRTTLASRIVRAAEAMTDGAMASKRGDIQSAISAYNRAAECDPLAAAPHYHLADCYLRQGRVGPALEEFKTLLRVNPWYAQGRLGEEIPSANAGLLAVRWLSIAGREIDNRVLAELTALVNLERLAVIGSRVTDSGLPQLTAFHRLANLDLAEAGISDAGLVELARLKSLRSLGLAETKISDVGIGQIAALAELQELDLGGTTIGDLGLKQLTSLQQLRRLVLRDTQITDAANEVLLPMKHLAVLDVTGTAIGNDFLGKLAELPSLRALRIEGTQVTDDGMASVARIKWLRRLYLSDTAITDRAFIELAKLPELECLTLAGTAITDAALARVADIPTLRELSLANTGVTDAGLLEHLGKMKRLETLDLSATHLTAEGWTRLVPHFGRSPIANLRSLSIAGTGFDVWGVLRLYGLPHLRELNVLGCSVPDDVAGELRYAFPRLNVRWGPAGKKPRWTQERGV